MDVGSEVFELREGLVELRSWFHMRPELGFREYGTSKKIAEYLGDLGLEVRTGVAHTALLASSGATGRGPRC